MCTNDFICFYDWADCRLIRRIDVNVKVSLLCCFKNQTPFPCHLVCYVTKKNLLFSCRISTGLTVVIWWQLQVIHHSTFWSTMWVLLRTVLPFYSLQLCDICSIIYKCSFVVLIVLRRQQLLHQALLCNCFSNLKVYTNTTLSLYLPEGCCIFSFGRRGFSWWGRCGRCLWTASWDQWTHPNWAMGWRLFYLQ